MRIVKATIGAIIAIGVPISAAFALAGAGYDFATDHVHDVSAKVQGNHAIMVVNDFHHSLGGIIAGAGAIGFAWVVITFFAVWAGGTMIAKSNQSWG